MLHLIIFLHSDKTLGRYRSSTLDHTSTWKASRQASEDHETELGIGHRESWENDSLIRDAKSSLPVVRHALHNEQVAADNKYDRLSLWVRNVEQVVQEAKETFASSTITPLPPLPARPVQRPASTRNVRPSRVPRKILPADQIFQVDAADSALSSNVPSTGCISPEKMSINIGAMLASPLEGLDFGLPTSSPRARRATVSATSPVLAAKTTLTDSFDGSPSKRKEKAKSSGNLASLVRPISPMSQIQKELEKGENLAIPNISDVLDRSIFIAGNGTTLPHQEDSFIPNISPPEANRKSSTLGPSNSPPTTNILRESSSSPILTSPHRRHIEGVYDRFLMAATGVKRVGRGYQSDMSAPAQMLPSLGAKKNSKIFSGRRPIRSVVSKDDLNKSGGVDDFGKFMTASYSSMSSHRDDANKSVRAVAKAFKAIVTGKTVARRQSKVL
ncbi:hypothetical protein DFH11DRAFT_1066492 [Phellopilus nigrolimitatus]|nr:hypothetical protein DFH11DRAFT_1066492 [Phellopilus nigrolimitatus]